MARDKKVLGTWFGPYKVTEYTPAPTPKGAAIVTYQTCKGATLSTKHVSDVRPYLQPYAHDEDHKIDVDEFVKKQLRAEAVATSMSIISSWISNLRRKWLQTNNNV